MAEFVKGASRVEKWISMTGWGCDLDGIEITCGTREWKTRLWRHTFKWSNTISLSEIVISPEMPPSLVPSAQPLAALPTTDFALKAVGSLNGHIPNDIVRFLADFGTALGTNFTEFHLEHLVPQPPSRLDKLDVRSKLYTDEADFLYQAQGRPFAKEGQRGFWHIFVDTLEVDLARTIFKNAGYPLMSLVFRQDNILFAKLIKLDNPRYAIDYFRRELFCADGGEKMRSEIRTYLGRMAAKIGGSQASVPVSGKRDQVLVTVEEILGNKDALPFLIRRGLISAGENGKFNGKIPSATELNAGPPFVRAWDNVDTLGSFYDADAAERRCLQALATSLHGSADLLFPFDDVSRCLPENNTVNRVQSTIADKSLRNSILGDGLISALALTSPVTAPAYRGWYYCYRNTSMCVGRNNIMWWQAASKFKARSGRHLGIDIYGDDGEGSTQIYAVTSGILSYSSADLTNWWHVLTLPFKSGNEILMAVYAHLPPSASRLHGKRVTAGEAIGTTGCSGNSGDGRGNCNTYCDYRGRFRTDEHLHFEVLKKNDSGWEKVDPLSYIPKNISDKGSRFLARCKDPAPAVVSHAN